MGTYKLKEFNLFDKNFSHVRAELGFDASCFEMPEYGVWSRDNMIWGSYVDWPSGEIGKFSAQIDPAVHLNGSYRKSQWSTSHLRTYKSHLWSRIKDEDFRDDSGEYFKASCDLAIMFPIVEMARERSRFIPNILLCYNRTNPAAEHLSSRNEQLSNESLIRSRKPYERVET